MSYGVVLCAGEDRRCSGAAELALVADELEFILKDSGTKRLIFDNEFVETVADLHSRGDKTDIKHWLQVAQPDEIAHFAEDYRAFRDAQPTTEPEINAADDDMLYIMYTSGTTGLPKVYHPPHVDLGLAEYCRDGRVSSP